MALADTPYWYIIYTSRNPKRNTYIIYINSRIVEETTRRTFLKSSSIAAGLLAGSAVVSAKTTIKTNSESDETIKIRYQ
ncbi:twin-arginine translocation signal domain-containing protein [Halorhabdus sp. CBA1104]|nr:twin-arginine translocation signal domain-containing protein [Halorhabdus sp. CBA1104]